ncbi:MAG: hypothetical protein IPF98_21940 [Gemmatimonadetes bacterium]|nr:hypothetical protein [Gemmatimonadota bacterium]MCC6770070.1 hypothetical protein [Gemmatimonadaceae bacterium]
MNHILSPVVRVVTLATLFAACSSASTTNPDGASANGAANVNVTATVSQSVSLSPVSPTSGTNVTVRSVLTNRGTSSFELDSRVCGLDYAGSLSLTLPPGLLQCLAYSQRRTILPGDSVVTLDYQRVVSPAGAYTLRVKHAVQPEAWAELQVQVR